MKNRFLFYWGELLVVLCFIDIKLSHKTTAISVTITVEKEEGKKRGFQGKELSQEMGLEQNS